MNTCDTHTGQTARNKRYRTTHAAKVRAAENLRKKRDYALNPKKYYAWRLNPLSQFNLADRNQFLKACHYSNLQPMWAGDNLRKGDRVN